MKIRILLLLGSLCLHAQSFEPQSVEQMQRLEYRAAYNIDYIWPLAQRMPIDTPDHAILPPVPAESGILEVIATAELAPYVDTIIVDVPVSVDCESRDCIPVNTSYRVVDADKIIGDVIGVAGSSPARLARLDDPPVKLPSASAGRFAVPGNIPGPPCPGVCATYSSQGSQALEALTGKRIRGFQEVQATVCSDRVADVPAGLIIQMANVIGVQTINRNVGAAIIQHTVSLNWRNLFINSIKYGSLMFLGFETAGVIHASLGTIFVTAFTHAAADDLPKLFAPGAPDPDPLLSSMTNDSGTLHVTPAACTPMLFAGVYGGPKTTFVSPKIQLLP